jgi:hypothetical protein
MSPDHGGKRSLALGDDQIRRHASALRAGIGNIVDGDVAALFDTGFLHVERSFLVIIKVTQQCNVDILRKESRGKQKDSDHNAAHEDLR